MCYIWKELKVKNIAYPSNKSTEGKTKNLERIKNWDAS